MRLMKQMIVLAEVSRSWMSIADDSVVYQSGAKFPLLIVVHLLSGGYRGQLDRVAICSSVAVCYTVAYIVTLGVTWRKSPSIAARVSGLYRDR